MIELFGEILNIEQHSKSSEGGIKKVNGANFLIQVKSGKLKNNIGHPQILNCVGH